MSEMSFSEQKFAISDWLLDNLGLESDDYTMLIDSAKSADEIAAAVSAIRRQLELRNVMLANKFHAHAVTVRM